MDFKVLVFEADVKFSNFWACIKYSCFSFSFSFLVGVRWGVELMLGSIVIEKEIEKTRWVGSSVNNQLNIWVYVE